MPIGISDTLIDTYIEAMKKEIAHYANTLQDKKLKTLYFGWGTPSRIGIAKIIDIIEYVFSHFDIEDLAEISIELNPYPEEEVLHFVKTLNKTYPKISRLRYSFGIQSFDDEVLQLTWRAYTFGGIVEFLRKLVTYKQDNNVFNFDFIAFGKFQISKNGFKQLWHEFKREFFQRFLDSGYADSISLYTLEGLKDKADELAKISKATQSINPPLCDTSKWHGTDDDILEEFETLKAMIFDSGYLRYEISNFCKAGKASIHNMVYWNRENYIGIGLSAASFTNKQWLANNPEAFQGFPISSVEPFGLRRTNTWDIKQYIEENRLDEQEVHVLNESDILIEEFFLRLRTREGLADISKFIPVLVSNYESLLQTYQKEGLLSFDGTKLQLTDEGMNVYNSIITDLLERL